MKRLIVIFFFIPFFAFAQTEYLPEIAWSTKITNSTFVNTDTFTVDVTPLDLSDHGAFPLRMGNYLVDNRGLRYEIIDTTSYPTITVVDIFQEGFAPFNNKIGYVYQSAGDGNSPSLPTHQFEKLDKKALDYAYRIDNEILWKEANLYAQDSAEIVWFKDSLITFVTPNQLTERTADNVEATAGLNDTKYLTPATNHFRDELINVPYIGARDDIDLDTFGISAKNGEFQYMDFDTAITYPDYQFGRLFFDSTRHDLGFYAEDTSIVHTGMDVVLRVFNDSGEDFQKGVALCYQSGVGVRLADTRERDKSDQIFVTGRVIKNGEWGLAVRLGEVDGLNTSGFTLYDLLYLGDNGLITDALPVDGDHPIIVGFVTKVGTTDGRIEVNPVISRQTVETTRVNGFPADERTGTIISFNDANRYFKIAADTPTVPDFHYYDDGRKWENNVADSIQIVNSTGIHVFYYSDSTIATIYQPTGADLINLVENECIIAYVYWNADSTASYYIGDERHNLADEYWHVWAHLNFGAQIPKTTIETGGYVLSNMDVDGSGNDSTAAQFGVTAGLLMDEDVAHQSPTIASTVGTPIFYKTGAAGIWTRVFQPGFSIYNGGTGAPYWNEYVGDTVWQLTRVANTDLCLMHQFATNGVDYQVITIMGESTYNTINDAQAAIADEVADLTFTGFPTAEFKWIASEIYEHNGTYSNPVQARIRSLDDGSDYLDGRITAIGTGAGGTGTTTTTFIDLDDTPALYPATNQILMTSGNEVVFNAKSSINVGDFNDDDTYLNPSDTVALRSDIDSNTADIASNSTEIDNVRDSIPNYEIDGSISNEGSLTVGVGTASTSTITSNTSGSNPVTLSEGNNFILTESGNTITMAVDEIDTLSADISPNWQTFIHNNEADQVYADDSASIVWFSDLTDSLNVIRDTTDALRVDINSNASDISDSLAQHRTEIDNLSDSIGVHRTDIYTNETNITGNSTEIDNVRDSIPDYETDPIYAGDSLNIVWFSDLTDSLNLVRDTTDALRVDINTNATDIDVAFDSISVHRTELNNISDSLVQHRLEIELNYDSLVVHRTDINANLDSINLFRPLIDANTGKDTTGIFHSNRAILDATTASFTTTISTAIDANTGKDTTGIFHANRTALDSVSGINTGDQDLSGIRDTLGFHSDSLILVLDSIAIHRTDINTNAANISDNVREKATLVEGITGLDGTKFPSVKEVMGTILLMQRDTGNIEGLQTFVENHSIDTFTETDQIYAGDSVNIVWFDDLADSLNVVRDTSGALRANINTNTINVQTNVDSLTQHRIDINQNSSDITDIQALDVVEFSDTISVIATKYDIDIITHFTNADETDQVYSGDSLNIVWFSDLDTLSFLRSETDPIYAGDSANIVLFEDTVSIMATKYDIDTITHFTNSDETDPIFTAEESNIAKLDELNFFNVGTGNIGAFFTSTDPGISLGFGDNTTVYTQLFLRTGDDLEIWTGNGARIQIDSAGTVNIPVSLTGNTGAFTSQFEFADGLTGQDGVTVSQLTDSLNVVRDTTDALRADLISLSDSIVQHRLDIELNYDSLVVHRTDINTNLDSIVALKADININSDSLVVHRTDINTNIVNIAANVKEQATIVEGITGLDSDKFPSVKEVMSTLKLYVQNDSINAHVVGTINGVNDTFTTNIDFIPYTTQLYVNGVRAELGFHYTESGTDSIVFEPSFIPETGERLVIDFKY